MKILAESSPRPRLSVAMIVRDEQDVLAASIESVHELADEIVVLDTGSGDRTPDLAVQLGAKLFRKPWDNDFAAARNHCLRMVAGDWVLWLDAGEQITADSAAQLRAFLDREAKAKTAYTTWIEIPPRESGASGEQVAQYRLLPTNAGIRFVGRVRESLEDSMRAAGVARGEAPCRIVRHPRQNEQDRVLAKARRDLALAAAESDASGRWPPRLLLCAGQAHSVLGEHDRARDMLREAIRVSAPASPERLEAYYGLLTTFDDDPEMHASQLTACLDSLEDFPFDMQLLLALGNYMLVRERIDLAIRAFEAAVRFGRVTPTVWHLQEAREISAVSHALALQARQRDDEARGVLETALDARPESNRLQQQLYLLHRKQGRTSDARALAARLPAEIANRGGEERLHVRIDLGQAAAPFSPHVAAPAAQSIAD